MRERQLPWCPVQWEKVRAEDRFSRKSGAGAQVSFGGAFKDNRNNFERRARWTHSTNKEENPEGRGRSLVRARTRGGEAVSKVTSRRT
jgi:hypothetical protein